MNSILIFMFFAQVSATQSIPVPKPFLECKSDADCQQTATLCGCCGFTGMNKRHVKKYAALARYCSEPAAPCACTPPKMDSKCLKKMCTLVTRN